MPPVRAATLLQVPGSSISSATQPATAPGLLSRRGGPPYFAGMQVFACLPWVAAPTRREMTRAVAGSQLPGCRVAMAARSTPLGLGVDVLFEIDLLSLANLKGPRCQHDPSAAAHLPTCPL